MTLYRASPKDGVAWITGGSSGIGRELAKELAAKGFVVAVTAREEDHIGMLIAETASLPGRIVAFPCDVTDEQGMANAVVAIETDLGPIALAVFNAGSYTQVAGDNLSVRKFRRTFDVNVMGIVHGLVPTVKFMRKRGCGHIVMVGSISAYFGWPTTAAYGATKAAINIMAQSLKFDLDKLNIRVQVMNPGFIDTPMTQKNGVRLPALISSACAADRMMRGIETGGFEITFPRRFTLWLKVLGMLPHPLRHWFLNRMTGWGDRPLSFGRKPRQPI
ncbi:SDR family NAD(P)-dependent oxidoreductase [Mesorhizobium sp. UC22_110]|jgi:NAD(P)-dependent dehydrogenase (short-subunit alcohol dehydrogenase family)|uniref:SDR family NAD(P)-dependent oxidoreductase n=1 Tax=unclassified Mesorhizobium TaxID=325217 RepID=UPI0036700590